jgi:Glycosyl transferase family 2
VIEVSVVIPTYNRPDLLARATASCLDQQGFDAPYEIIIVDNNPEGSARASVEEMAGRSPVPIRYVGEPRSGISYARNAGVAAAAGRYIAFLDDDEEADPGWLAAHLEAIRRFGADLVVGPVHACFPPGIGPVGPYPRDKFSREMPLPTGASMPRIPGIGNTLLNRERCFVDPEPFDLRLGLTGGEDTLFLRQLLRRGRTMVWCAEASVRETVPVERLAPRFLLRRAFHRGQATTFACAAVKPPDHIRVVRMMVAGCAQVLLFGVPALLLRTLRHRRWLPLMDRAALGLGKLLWHPSLQRRFYR